MGRDFDERQVTDAIRRVLGGQAHGVKLGIGDDAAVVEPDVGDTVLTADVAVEGVHFDLELDAARDVGYKALVANVSDIAAMAASPRFGVVSLVLTERTDMAWVVELCGGMREAADEYALALVGGDLSSGSQVVVSIAVTGSVAPGRALTRAGAGVGDRLVVTGSLGAAAGGLALSRAPAGPASRLAGEESVRAVLAAHARPVARLGEGQLLASSGATAMMDVSDGLGIDLARLCEASGVGARVALDAIPVAPGLEALREPLGLEPLALALGGGEDFELLASLPSEALDQARSQLWDAYAVRLTDIGEMTDASSGVTAVAADGSETPLDATGWDHFARA